MVGEQEVNPNPLPPEDIVVATSGEPQTSASCVDEKQSEDSKVIAQEEAAKKASFLGEGPLGKTIWRLTWPDFIGKVVQALYVMVDAIFIGNMAGSNQQEKSLSLASCTLVMPIDQLFHIALSLLVGVGTSALYGQSLGRKDIKGARKVIGNMYVMCIFIGIVYPLVVSFFVDDLLILAGASEADGTLALAREYFTPLMYGMIICCLALCHNNSIRGEGNSLYSATCMLVGGITNIIMDPILIRATGNSIRGAAFATMCGNGLSTLMGIYYFLSKRGAVVLQWSDFIPDFRVIFNILSVGISGFISSASSSIVSIVMNNLLLKYASLNYNTLQVTEILAVVGACGKFSFFCFMPMMSLSHGCLPIYSYCYGARKNKRFVNAMKIQFFCEIIVGAVLTVAGATLGQFVSRMFSSSIFFKNVFAEALRYVTSGLVFNAFTMSVFPALQAIGRGLPSAIILFLKQLVFLLAFAQLFCATLHDWWGNMYAYPLAEICGAIISVTAFFIYRKVFYGVKQ